jgi:DNA-binding NarL/FixJ family response regulator
VADTLCQQRKRDGEPQEQQTDSGPSRGKHGEESLHAEQSALVSSGGVAHSRIVRGIPFGRSASLVGRVITNVRPRLLRIAARVAYKISEPDLRNGSNIVSTTPHDGVIRIMTADDHQLLREGIAAVLSDQADMTLIGEAGSGREAIETFRRLRPDVTLMDLRMPDISGIEAICAIRAEFPNARIIVLTTYAGDVQAAAALKAGAAGYLLKGLVRKELIETIRAVHAGKRRVPAEIATEIAEHVADDALTERETEVLRRVAAGKSNKLIAVELNISEGTVKTHMKSILPKLDASDRTHAVMIALKRGILDL